MKTIQQVINELQLRIGSGINAPDQMVEVIIIGINQEIINLGVSTKGKKIMTKVLKMVGDI